MFESVKREAKLTIRSGDIVVVKLALFKEEEDVVEEMGEKDK
jgi:hypothetical protein